MKAWTWASSDGQIEGPFHSSPMVLGARSRGYRRRTVFHAHGRRHGHGRHGRGRQRHRSGRHGHGHEVSYGRNGDANGRGPRDDRGRGRKRGYRRRSRRPPHTTQSWHSPRVKTRWWSHGTGRWTGARRHRSSTGTPARWIPTPRSTRRTLTHPRETHPRVRHPGRTVPVTPRSSCNGRHWHRKGTPLTPSTYKLSSASLRRGGVGQGQTYRNRSNRSQRKRNRNRTRGRDRRRRSRGIINTREWRFGKERSNLCSTGMELLLDLGLLRGLPPLPSASEYGMPAFACGRVQVRTYYTSCLLITGIPRQRVQVG